MGLLDDAIREHLDLKRQRGADPGEIERLEREALGPVRREPRGHAAGAVPHLAVDVDPERHFDPPTELLQDGGRAPEPKRGFLRRGRSAPASEPAPSDFADQLDAGLHGEPGDSHGDHLEHADPFGQAAFDHDDPFRDDEPSAHEQPFHDEPALDDDPATHEHSAAPFAAEPPIAESLAAGPPLAEPPLEEPPPAAPPVQPEVEAEPPHLIFDSAPPPRPTFAPVPPAANEPEPEPAPADSAELESEATEHPAAAAEPAPPVAPAAAEPALDQRARADAARETREWSVEEAFAAEDSGQAAPAAEPDDEEDPLEETPEFLQDTPDHDRLWFEQRPPRDFDFDG
jgi:hypothetical protein